MTLQIAHVAKFLVPAVMAGVLCLGFPASAQAPGDTDEIEHRSLTETDVRRFVASYPEVEALGRQYDRDWTGGMETMPLAMGAEAMAAMDRVVKAHGFADFTDWIQVAQSVVLAYSIVKTGMTVEEMRMQAEMAMQQMQAMPGMTEAQKQEMVAMMEESMGALLRVQPPPENIALVRGMMDEIDPIMEDN